MISATPKLQAAPKRKPGILHDRTLVAEKNRNYYSISIDLDIGFMLEARQRLSGMLHCENSSKN